MEVWGSDGTDPEPVGEEGRARAGAHRRGRYGGVCCGGGSGDWGIGCDCGGSGDWG